jgi:glycine dehydrogenase subunit 1
MHNNTGIKRNKTHPYLPHTTEDITIMLRKIGIESIDSLFADIPRELMLQKTLNLPEGLSEFQVYKKIQSLALQNKIDLISFLGCGSYDHIVPAVIGYLTSRPEFSTAYTPYQAEMSQGLLQAIFEFQTMICQLTGMDVSNASLYDGHTAVSEAAVMALNSVRRSDTVLYSNTIHPYTRMVLKTHFLNLPVTLEEIPSINGATDMSALAGMLRSGVAGVILQSPNYLGVIEDLNGIADLIHQNGSLFILSANPISLGTLKPAGEWGADIAVGDVQPLGLPSYFGGPTAGYIAASEKLLRKMPGRIAGQSLDRDGKRAFILTLQAREQHIKRAKATSNICSNQALAALAVTIYLSLMGKQGLREVSEQNIQKAHYLHDALLEKTTVRAIYDRPFFNEFAILLPESGASPHSRSRGFISHMEREGFYAGVDLHSLDPAEQEGAILIAVTEKRTRQEMDRFVGSVMKVLK